MQIQTTHRPKVGTLALAIGVLVAFGAANACSTGFGYAPAPQARLRHRLAKLHGWRAVVLAPSPRWIGRKVGVVRSNFTTCGPAATHAPLPLV